MKVTFSMIACLILAGILSAAEVGGNNTAVVIQKAKAQSKTGWQLLCVPVNELQISGATTNNGIEIATILPPSSFPEGTSVYIDNTLAYTLTKPEGSTALSWAANTSRSSETKLRPGQEFWLKKPDGADTMPAATTFCGQNRDQTTIVRPTVAGSAELRKNDSATAIKISAIVPDGIRKGDQILCVENGKNEYKMYQRGTSKWYLDGVAVTDTDVIAPGEAFYYYAK